MAARASSRFRSTCSSPSWRSGPRDGEILGPPKPPKFDKTAKQHPDRRLLLVMRQRGKSHGKEVATRVAIALREATHTVVAMATKFASAESRIMSDEGPGAYSSFWRMFAKHDTINHSKTYRPPGRHQQQPGRELQLAHASLGGGHLPVAQQQVPGGLRSGVGLA